MIRFHLDEHVDHAVAKALTARGIDVTTTTDAGLPGEPDHAHLEHARNTGRVLFTNDADFLRLADAGEPHSGIVYCAPGSRSVGDIVRFLCLMHDYLSEDEVKGVIEYL